MYKVINKEWDQESIYGIYYFCFSDAWRIHATANLFFVQLLNKPLNDYINGKILRSTIKSFILIVVFTVLCYVGNPVR